MVKKYMDETKKGFMQNIGDLSFKKIDETNYEFSIKVEEKFRSKPLVIITKPSSNKIFKSKFSKISSDYKLSPN